MPRRRQNQVQSQVLSDPTQPSSGRPGRPALQTDPRSVGYGIGPNSGQTDIFWRMYDEAIRNYDDAQRNNKQRYKQLGDINIKQVQTADKAYQDTARMLEEDNAATSGGYQQAQQYLNQRRQNLAGAYDSARGDVEQIGNRALEDANRREQSAQAQTLQSGIDRGFYSSSVLDSLRQRNREAGGRERGGIYESIAGLRSGLTERGGQALSQADADIAGFQQQRTNAEQAGRLRQVDARNQSTQYRNALLSDRSGIVERRQDQSASPLELGGIAMQYKAYQDAQKNQGGGLGSFFSGLLGTAGGAIAGGIGQGIGNGIGGAFGGLFGGGQQSQAAQIAAPNYTNAHNYYNGGSLPRYR